MPNQIGIFAKYWTPGRVKTRLAATIGDESAAHVARLFIETLLARLPSVGDQCVVGFAPAEQESAFRAAAGEAWRLWPQCNGDLGQRMHAYFADAFAHGADRVVLLGADSPNLPHTTLQAAFDALDTAQLVLAPSEDGGYCLIGARAEPPPVFDDMPWSSETLWDATQTRLDQLGWRRGDDWHALPTWYDVDDNADLARLRQDIAAIDNDPALARLGQELDRLLTT